MLQAHAFTALAGVNYLGLSATTILAEVAAQMLAQIHSQSQQIASQSQQIAERDGAIKFKDARLERITFELARLGAWKFSARTEAMNAVQRQLFEETLAADEASLQAQLEALQAQAVTPPAAAVEPKRQPRRQALPEHLERIEHHHEPENTTCPTQGCGQPMQRMGEDVSERLDIVPAQFFVHRHIRGKWACRCCQLLVQEPVEPQIIDNGMPTAGLVTHTLVSRFIDHLPYYRQEAINARSGVHTPRSPLAAWSGRGGAALQPLFDVHRRVRAGCAGAARRRDAGGHAGPWGGQDEEGLRLGLRAGLSIQRLRCAARCGFPTHKKDFCLGRGAKYPTAFLHGWAGTLVRDEFKGYESVLKQDGRTGAGCLAHVRRKFDELIKVNQSPVAQQAVQRIAMIYRVEREARDLTADARLAMRQARSKPLWEELHVWLRLERVRVPEGSAIARAIDYSLNAWGALTAHLHDGRVPVDNNHVENLMRPWAIGRKAWLFADSELAGQRAAVVMSLVQSANLNGHDPWAYLKDVLTRLPTQLNSRIDELLPHLWKPHD